MTEVKSDEVENTLALTASANPDFGYVTLCDTMDSMILWTKGTLLQTHLNTG